MNKLKIKSITDVITNSSSETYIINAPFMSADEVKKKFEAYMNKNHWVEWNEGEPELLTHDTYHPDDYVDIGNGYVEINWYVMCNLDNAYEYLCNCFGRVNVLDENTNIIKSEEEEPKWTIMRRLTGLMQKYPDLRFGQALYNLGIVDNPEKFDLFNISDKDLLKLMKEVQ